MAMEVIVAELSLGELHSQRTGSSWISPGIDIDRRTKPFEKNRQFTKGSQASAFHAHVLSYCKRCFANFAAKAACSELDSPCLSTARTCRRWLRNIAAASSHNPGNARE